MSSRDNRKVAVGETHCHSYAYIGQGLSADLERLERAGLEVEAQQLAGETGRPRRTVGVERDAVRRGAFGDLPLVGHERLRVDIPESDYARLVTLNDLVAYLVSRGPEPKG